MFSWWHRSKVGQANLYFTPSNYIVHQRTGAFKSNKLRAKDHLYLIYFIRFSYWRHTGVFVCMTGAYCQVWSKEMTRFFGKFRVYRWLIIIVHCETRWLDDCDSGSLQACNETSSHDGLQWNVSMWRFTMKQSVQACNRTSLQWNIFMIFCDFLSPAFQARCQSLVFFCCIITSYAAHTLVINCFSFNYFF